MPYTPNPLDDTQPDDGVFAGTAAAEFRALKTALAASIVGDTYEGEWSTLTGALAKGSFVTHNDAMWLNKVALADVTTVEPTLANSSTWFRFTQVSTGGFVAKTSDTGSALLPVGTVAQRDVTPASGAIRFNADSDEWEGYNGTSWVPLRKKLRATLSTASGSALVEHTGIPAGIEEIVVDLQNVSLSGTGNLLIQIGGTAIAVTGYTDCRAFTTSDSSSTALNTDTAGFVLRAFVATRQLSGALVLRKMSGNIWKASGVFTAVDIYEVATGTKDLAAEELTRVGIIPTAGNFDGGEVHILY